MAFRPLITRLFTPSFPCFTRSFTSKVASPSSSSPRPPSSGVSSRLTAAQIRNLKGFIIDMDGVIYHLQKVIPGALDFIAWLKANEKKFLFLTNSSERAPKELSAKLQRMGIDVSPEHFYTSALATAQFLARQKPGGSAYVIGEPGLTSALYDVGYSMNDSNPDYVVVGETRNYNYSLLENAVHLVRKGARLIGTNCDIADRTQDSFIPACGSLVKPIELASGREAYFIGKPNPLIMRAALGKLQISRSEACILGDRMDTDILAGVQSEINTVLLLTGVTSLSDVANFAYRPDCILPSAGHVLTDGNEVWEPK
jgi:NagD protein